MSYGEFGTLDALALLGIGAFYAVSELYDRLTDDDTGPVDDAEAARHAYVTGEIDEGEMERRLALALDEDRQELRRRVEDIPGVGPDTSAALAREFHSVDDLATTDTEEIADRVHGVGESTAEAVHEVIR